MEDLVEALTGGNVTPVKVVLASVLVALAVYQVLLATVVYGRLRPRFLRPPAAALGHRAVGDAVVVITVIVAVMCLSVFGFDDDGAVGAAYALAGALLLVVLTVKIAVVRWWHGLGRYLPLLGVSVFVLFLVTWATSAGGELMGG